MLQPGFWVQSLSDSCGKISKPKTDASPTHSSNTFPSPVSLSNEICFGLRLAYLLVRERRNPSQHTPKQPPREVTLRQQQPVISGVLDQSSTRFHQPLLQARQRPVLDSLRQHQPPPQVHKVVGQHAQPESYLIGPEMMAAQPRHLHRLLAFFDPLLRRASLVVETDHSPTVHPQIGHDESDSGEQLPKVELHLRHHPPRRLPTRRLIEKALVPDHGFMTGPSYRPRQQLVDVPLQIAVGRDADGVLR